MTQDRIQINGVWYIKEDTKQEPIKLDLIEFVGMLHENDKYCWKAIKLYKGDGETFYDGIDIEFTDKRNKPWKEDHWDNDNWIIGVYGSDEDSMKIAREVMCEEGIRTFQAFVGALIEKEWI